MLGAQSLRNPDCFLGILVVIDDANAGVSASQSAIDFSLGADVMIQISDQDRPGHGRHKMRKRPIGRTIKTCGDHCNPDRGFGGTHGCLVPSFGEVGLSNFFGSSSGTGILGTSVTADVVKGSTMVVVTSTISSEIVLIIERDRNGCHRIGIASSPGTWEWCD